MALLKRQMRFKAIAIIEVGSITTGTVVGIVMAQGLSILVMVGRVWQRNPVIDLTGLVSRWRPQLPSEA